MSELIFFEFLNFNFSIIRNRIDKGVYYFVYQRLLKFFSFLSCVFLAFTPISLKSRMRFNTHWSSYVVAPLAIPSHTCRCEICVMVTVVLKQFCYNWLSEETPFKLNSFRCNNHNA